jgi:hypothetical protein
MLKVDAGIDGNAVVFLAAAAAEEAVADEAVADEAAEASDITRRFLRGTDRAKDEEELLLSSLVAREAGTASAEYVSFLTES